MSEGRTEREALLEARVKELEAAAAVRENQDTSGGIFEQAWRFLSAFVPPWIIAAGVGVFLIFHGWEYYNQAQMAVAETQLTKSQAALKDAEARAQTAMNGDDTVRLATVKAEMEKTQQEAARARVEADAQTTKIGDATVRAVTVKAELEKAQQEAARAKIEADAQTAKIGDETVRLATVKAELEKAQQEAARAKIEADAQNAKIGDETVRVATVKAESDKAQQDAARARIEADAQNSVVQDATMRLSTLQAELANKQAEAAKARAAADAANQRYGLQTLEERAATAKLVLSELEAADARGSTASQAALGSGSILAVYMKTARAMCANNRYAQLINCPPQFITSAPPAPQVAVRSVISQPDATQPLRKPTMFDCSRASMGTDYVICASDMLLDAEARLEDAYKAALAARGDEVKTAQWAWIKRYGPDCGLPLRGRPAPDQISGARSCVQAAMNNRIRELQAEQ